MVVVPLGEENEMNNDFYNPKKKNKQINYNDFYLQKGERLW